MFIKKSSVISKNKKILIFSQHFWPETFIINSIVDSLFLSGLMIEVITGKPNYPQGKIYDGYSLATCSSEFRNGYLVHRLPIFPRGLNNPLFLTLNYLSYLISALFFTPWILKRKKFDLIFVYATSPILQVIPAIFISRLKRIPTVIWVQDLWPESVEATGYIKNKYLLFFLKKIVTYIYNNTNCILVSSQGFIGPIKKITTNKNIIYIPNPVDIYSSKVTSKRSLSRNYSSESFTVLFTGNVGKAQSLEVVLEAAYILKKHKNIFFLIVGGGSELLRLIDLAKSLDLYNVKFTGHLDKKLMPELMKNSSALLLSLSNDYIFSLTVPSKLQAYMFSGKPIIASINGEVEKIIRTSKCGIAVESKNPTKLSRAILKLSRMEKIKRMAMGANAKKYATKHFQHKKIVKNIHSVFVSVMSDFVK